MLSIPLTSEGLEMDSTLELYNLEGEKGDEAGTQNWVAGGAAKSKN